MVTYTSVYEILQDYYTDKLNEFDSNLLNCYIHDNFNDQEFDDHYLDIRYKNGCTCNIENCNCNDNIKYNDIEFLHNKEVIFPKNYFTIKYFNDIFPKHHFRGKCFFYLPENCFTITKEIFDTKNTADSYQIYRNITYYFINKKLILVKDELYSKTLGQLFYNYHTPCSMIFEDYCVQISA